MEKFPVTQAQYRAVMGQNPSKFKRNGAVRPVEQVSWYEAVAFCENLSYRTRRSYRLPSEAEWEYACRAGTTTSFHFGASISHELAHCDVNLGKALVGLVFDVGGTTEVGRFPANNFGLYDMHGNAFEWCQDAWHSNYEGAPTDGSAWMAGGDNSRRVLRGGSWFYVPRLCRSAYRYDINAGNRSSSFGFRVCYSAPRT
jgi:formylglycine-generating enzyme required for sulfatase activity